MSHIPAQGPYTDTLIVDCSRQTSEEVKGDPTSTENSVFTNKMGNGIKINPGDKISVSSAYVSERGCGGQVIEFKGEKQENQEYTLYESVITKPQLPDKFPMDTSTTDFEGLDKPRNLTHPPPLADFGPMRAKKVVHTRTAQTYQLSDNEVNLEISYYKTTNGEGYMHLPRRYDMKPKLGQTQITGKPPETMKVRAPGENNPDMLGQSNLNSMSPAVDYDCPYNGRACVSPKLTKLCPADWYIYQGLEDLGWFDGIPLVSLLTPTLVPECHMLRSVCSRSVPRAGGLWDVSSLETHVIPKQVGHDGHAFQSFCSKQKNDNSRYTIYAKDLCYYSEHIGDQPNDLSSLTNKPNPTYEVPNEYTDVDPGAGNRYGDPYPSRDDFRGNLGTATPGEYDISYDKEPAMSGYTKYTEIKNLKVPKGFNSPSNVAETLTNQLNATKEQRIIHGQAGPWLGPYTDNPSAEVSALIIGIPAKQGHFDPREYNARSAELGFYDTTTATSDENIEFTTYGTTLATGQRQILVSTVLESETFKSFACGNYDTWSEDNFIGYRGGDPRNVGAEGTPHLAATTDPAPLPYVPWYTIPDAPETTTLANASEVDNIKTSTWVDEPHTSTTHFREVKPNDVANIQYLSNYQYIGVKRPELFDAYREFWKPQIETGVSWRNLDSYQCLTGIDQTHFALHPFITNAEWTDENLLRFKAVFDAQAKYPEIFEGYQYSNIESSSSQYNRITYPDVAQGVSPDYMRFLHINTWSGYTPDQRVVQRPGFASASSINRTPVYKSYANRMPLGNDNCNTPLTDPHATTSGVATWKENLHTDDDGLITKIPVNTSRNAQDFASAPLFVWYNDADQDLTDNDGNQFHRLAYGTMFKFTITDPAIARTKICDDSAGVPIYMDNTIVADIWALYVADPTSPISFIGFNTKNIGGIPDHLSDPWAMVAGTGEPGIAHPTNWFGGVAWAGEGCGCGFDIHFNAYGTSCIALYSGYLNGDKYAVETLKHGTDIPGIATDNPVLGEFYMDRGTSDPSKIALTHTTTGTTKAAATSHSTTIILTGAPIPLPTVGELIKGTTVQEPCELTGYDAGTFTCTVSPPQSIVASSTLTFWTAQEQVSYYNEPISKFIRERYVGANQPLLSFDDKGERFNFQQLHSPIYIGNEANAGDGLTSVALEEGKAVLQINRRLMGNDFTPEMMPYRTPIATSKDSTDSDQTPPIQPMNSNIIPWQVYDSDCGIFLENFGMDAEQWKLSLWGVLGFSYGQFHPTGTANRQARINNIIETTNLLVPTTNANLEASDVVKFRGNRYGSSLYTYQPPISSCLGPLSSALAQKDVDYPVIVIDQTSAQINAQNLPRKMLKPFFLVKSNIIGDMSYWGGGDSGQNVPIVCVINKENAFGDFYFQRGFDMEFTATIPYMLTSITTSIHDPDMKLSNVGPDSSVVYKIVKQNFSNLDVVSDVLQQQQAVMVKHKDKLKFMAEEQARASARVKSQEPVADPMGIADGVIERLPLDERVQDPVAPARPLLAPVNPVERAPVQSRNIGRVPARAIQQLSARPVSTRVHVRDPQEERREREQRPEPRERPIAETVAERRERERRRRDREPEPER